MNKSYKSYAFLLAMTVAIASPVRAMENQIEVTTQQEAQEGAAEQPVVWYKKCSNQVAAGVVVLAAAYALAVHMDTISSPTALFCSPVAPALTDTQSVENDTPKTYEPAVDPLTMVDADNTPLVDEKNDEIGGADMESYTPVAPSNQNIETPEISVEGNVQQKLEQLKAAVVSFFKTPADENPATDDLFRTQYE